MQEKRGSGMGDRAGTWNSGDADDLGLQSTSDARMGNIYVYM